MGLAMAVISYMPRLKKIIVFGGSAGSIQALCKVLEALPASVEAALLAVVHTGEEHNLLGDVFARCTKLKVQVVNKGLHLVPGCLFLAPANRHLLVQDGCVLSLNGPRENRHRPAVDVLFRSAARAHHSNVIGVIMSGALDDGSAGALAIKARGGTLIVQDPSAAEQPSMPANALQYVGADYSLPVSQIAPMLEQLVSAGKGGANLSFKKANCKKLSIAPDFQEDQPVAFSCPDCGGALSESIENGMPQYRCHVGHAFSLQSLSEAETETLERAVWIAYRQLKERHSIQLRLAKYDHRNRNGSRYEEIAASAAKDMKLLHGILARL